MGKMVVLSPVTKAITSLLLGNSRPRTDKFVMKNSVSLTSGQLDSFRQRNTEIVSVDRLDYTWTSKILTNRQIAIGPISELRNRSSTVSRLMRLLLRETWLNSKFKRLQSMLSILNLLEVRTAGLPKLTRTRSRFTRNMSTTPLRSQLSHPGLVGAHSSNLITSLMSTGALPLKKCLTACWTASMSLTRDLVHPSLIRPV